MNLWVAPVYADMDPFEHRKLAIGDQHPDADWPGTLVTAENCQELLGAGTISITIHDEISDARDLANSSIAQRGKGAGWQSNYGSIEGDLSYCIAQDRTTASSAVTLRHVPLDVEDGEEMDLIGSWSLTRDQLAKRAPEASKQSEATVMALEELSRISDLAARNPYFMEIFQHNLSTLTPAASLPLEEIYFSDIDGWADLDGDQKEQVRLQVQYLYSDRQETSHMSLDERREFFKGLIETCVVEATPAPRM